MINNSFNLNEFDSSVRKTIDQYNTLISKFPRISSIYAELADLTASDDNQITAKLRQLSSSTTTLNDKCKSIGSRMEDWLNRYRNTMSQTEADLKNTISKVSNNLARYNQELSSLKV